MKAGSDFQNLFSALETEATQALIDELGAQVLALETNLKETELRWAKLHVKRNLFGQNALTTEEKKALEPHTVLALRDDIKRTRARLEAAEKHLSDLRLTQA